MKDLQYFSYVVAWSDYCDSIAFTSEIPMRMEDGEERGGGV